MAGDLPKVPYLAGEMVPTFVVPAKSVTTNSASAQKGSGMKPSTVLGWAVVVIVVGWFSLAFLNHYDIVKTPPPNPFEFLNHGSEGQGDFSNALPPNHQFNGSVRAPRDRVASGSNPTVINPGGKRLPLDVANKLCEQTGEGQNIDITPYVGPGFESINCVMNR